MGGGIKFKVRLPNGSTPSVIGKYVGAVSPGVGQIYVQDDPNGLKTGFYDVNSNNIQQYVAELSPDALARQNIQIGKDAAGNPVGARTAEDIPDVASVPFSEAPTGWKVTEKDQNDNPVSFATDDGDFGYDTKAFGAPVIWKKDSGIYQKVDDWAQAIDKINNVDSGDEDWEASVTDVAEANPDENAKKLDKLNKQRDMLNDKLSKTANGDQADRISDQIDKIDAQIEALEGQTSDQGQTPAGGSEFDTDTNGVAKQGFIIPTGKKTADASPEGLAKLVNDEKDYLTEGGGKRLVIDDDNHTAEIYSSAADLNEAKAQAGGMGAPEIISLETGEHITNDKADNYNENSGTPEGGDAPEGSGQPDDNTETTDQAAPTSKSGTGVTRKDVATAVGWSGDGLSHYDENGQPIDLTQDRVTRRAATKFRKDKHTENMTPEEKQALAADLRKKAAGTQGFEKPEEAKPRQDALKRVADQIESGGIAAPKKRETKNAQKSDSDSQQSEGHDAGSNPAVDDADQPAEQQPDSKSGSAADTGDESSTDSSEQRGDADSRTEQQPADSDATGTERSTESAPELDALDQEIPKDIEGLKRRLAALERMTRRVKADDPNFDKAHEAYQQVAKRLDEQPEDHQAEPGSVEDLQHRAQVLQDAFDDPNIRPKDKIDLSDKIDEIADRIDAKQDEEEAAPDTSREGLQAHLQELQARRDASQRPAQQRILDKQIKETQDQIDALPEEQGDAVDAAAPEAPTSFDVIDAGRTGSDAAKAFAQKLQDWADQNDVDVHDGGRLEGMMSALLEKPSNNQANDLKVIVDADGVPTAVMGTQRLVRMSPKTRKFLPSELSVVSLYTREDGTGAGSHLMQEAAKEASDLHRRLTVSGATPEAVPYYKKLGATFRDGARPDGLSDGTWSDKKRDALASPTAPAPEPEAAPAATNLADKYPEFAAILDRMFPSDFMQSHPEANPDIYQKWDDRALSRKQQILEAVDAGDQQAALEALGGHSDPDYMFSDDPEVNRKGRKYADDLAAAQQAIRDLTATPSTDTDTDERLADEQKDFEDWRDNTLPNMPDEEFNAVYRDNPSMLDMLSPEEREAVQNEIARRAPQQIGLTDAQIDSIIQATNENGGGSFDLINGGQQPTDGFMVGVPGHELRLTPEQFTPDAIRQYVEDNQDVLNQSGNHLGTWVADDGRIVLDVSEREPDQATAIQKGEERNQEGIYDVANQEFISTGGTGEETGNRHDEALKWAQDNSLPDEEAFADWYAQQDPDAFNDLNDAYAQFPGVPEEAETGVEPVSDVDTDTNAEEPSIPVTLENHFDKANPGAQITHQVRTVAQVIFGGQTVSVAFRKLDDGTWVDEKGNILTSKELSDFLAAHPNRGTGSMVTDRYFFNDAPAKARRASTTGGRSHRPMPTFSINTDDLSAPSDDSLLRRLAELDPKSDEAERIRAEIAQRLAVRHESPGLLKDQPLDLNEFGEPTNSGAAIDFGLTDGDDEIPVYEGDSDSYIDPDADPTPEQADETRAMAAGVLNEDNIPFKDADEDYADEDFMPSDEQRGVIRAIMSKFSVVVQALAGSGKSTTVKLAMRRLAKDRPNIKGHYLVFNRRNNEEFQDEKKNGKRGKQTIPSGFDSTTFEGLSFRGVPKWVRDRFNASKNSDDRILKRFEDIATHFDLKNGLETEDGQHRLDRFETVAGLRDAIKAFTISPDRAINMQHLDKAGLPRTQEALDAANAFWDDMVSEDGVLGIDNGVITKMFALSDPDLKKMLGIDVLFVDEAQDMNPVWSDLLKKQAGLQQVLVGDSRQAIYGFRGGVDELDNMPSDIELPLTTTWRFGPQIAGIGNRFLSLLGSKYKIRGGGQEGSVVEPSSMENPDAVLTRSVAGAIGEIMNQLQNGKKVGSNSNFKNEATQFLESLRALRNNDHAKVKHPELSKFSSYEEFEKDARSGKLDARGNAFFRVIDTYGQSEVESAIAAILITDGSRDSHDWSTKPGSSGPLSTKELWKKTRDGRNYKAKSTINYEIEDNGDGTVNVNLTGDTFDFKDDIKTAGLRWDKSFGAKGAWRLLGADQTEAEAALSRLAGQDRPDVVVMTAHTSKGMEWPNVKIGDDFRGPQADPKTGEMVYPEDEEIRLAYVAVTRAQNQLDPGALSWIMGYTNDEDEDPDVPAQGKPTGWGTNEEVELPEVREESTPVPTPAPEAEPEPEPVPADLTNDELQTAERLAPNPETRDRIQAAQQQREEPAELPDSIQELEDMAGALESRLVRATPARARVLNAQLDRIYDKIESIENGTTEPAQQRSADDLRNEVQDAYQKFSDVLNNEDSTMDDVDQAETDFESVRDRNNAELQQEGEQPWAQPRLNAEGELTPENEENTPEELQRTIDGLKDRLGTAQRDRQRQIIQQEIDRTQQRLDDMQAPAATEEAVPEAATAPVDKLFNYVTDIGISSPEIAERVNNLIQELSNVIGDLPDGVDKPKLIVASNSVLKGMGLTRHRKDFGIYAPHLNTIFITERGLAGDDKSLQRTLNHEFEHFLFSKYFTRPDVSAEQKQVLDNLVKTVRSSESYKRLVKQLNAKIIGNRSYWLDKDETLARAFADYITYANGHDSQVNRSGPTGPVIQFDHSELAPIHEAFDRLLSAHGLQSDFHVDPDSAPDMVAAKAKVDDLLPGDVLDLPDMGRVRVGSIVRTRSGGRVLHVGALDPNSPLFDANESGVAAVPMHSTDDVTVFRGGALFDNLVEQIKDHQYKRSPEYARQILAGKDIPADRRQEIEDLLSANPSASDVSSVLEEISGAPNLPGTATKPKQRPAQRVPRDPETEAQERDPLHVIDTEHVMDLVRRDFPDHTTRGDNELVIATKDENGKRYDLVVRRTAREKFFAYVSETDLQTGAQRVLRLREGGAQNHSYTALMSQINQGLLYVSNPGHTSADMLNNSRRRGEIETLAPGERLTDGPLSEFIDRTDWPMTRSDSFNNAVAAIAELLDDPSVQRSVLDQIAAGVHQPSAFVDKIADAVARRKQAELEDKPTLQAPSHVSYDGQVLQPGDVVDWTDTREYLTENGNKVPNPNYGRVYRGYVRTIENHKVVKVGEGYAYKDTVRAVFPELNKEFISDNPGTKRKNASDVSRVSSKLKVVSGQDAPLSEPFFSDTYAPDTDMPKVTAQNFGSTPSTQGGTTPRAPQGSNQNNNWSDFSADENTTTATDGGNLVYTGNVDLVIPDNKSHLINMVDGSSWVGATRHDIRPGDILKTPDGDLHYVVATNDAGSYSRVKIVRFKSNGEDMQQRDVRMTGDKKFGVFRPKLEDVSAGDPQIAKMKNAVRMIMGGKSVPDILLPQINRVLTDPDATMNELKKVLSTLRSLKPRNQTRNPNNLHAAIEGILRDARVNPALAAAPGVADLPDMQRVLQQDAARLSATPLERDRVGAAFTPETALQNIKPTSANKNHVEEDAAEAQALADVVSKTKTTLLDDITAKTDGFSAIFRHLVQDESGNIYFVKGTADANAAQNEILSAAVANLLGFDQVHAAEVVDYPHAPEDASNVVVMTNMSGNIIGASDEGKRLLASMMRQRTPEKDVVNMGILDYITDQGDRNPGNYFFVEDPDTGEFRIAPVDSEFAAWGNPQFADPEAHTPESTFFTPFSADLLARIRSGNAPVSSADLLRLRNALGALRSAFSAMGAEDKWNGMMQRIATLINGVNGYDI